MAEVKQWIHLNEMHYNRWVLPIYAAWDRAANEKRTAGRDSATTPDRDGVPVLITEVGLRVTTRLTLIRHIVQRMKEDFLELAKSIGGDVPKEHFSTPDKEGVALPVDDRLKYLLVADLHSVISETDALLEGMKKFMRALHDHVGQPIDKKQVAALIDGWLLALGIGPEWFKEMSDARNFVAHDGAFYPALDTTESSWDVLLVKENVKQFDDPTTFVRTQRVMELVTHVMDCQGPMQAHLIKLFETATPPKEKAPEQGAAGSVA